MVIGFSGTQRGMTDDQARKVQHILIDLAKEGHLNTTLHHGDCIGADAQAHQFAFYLGFKIEIHPPLDDSKRAFANRGRFNSPGTVTWLEKEYLARNKDIVDACEVLVAAPYQLVAAQRSGTWATIREARRQKKRVIVVYRDGTYNSDYR